MLVGKGGPREIGMAICQDLKAANNVERSRKSKGCKKEGSILHVKARSGFRRREYETASGVGRGKALRDLKKWNLPTCCIPTASAQFRSRGWVQNGNTELRRQEKNRQQNSPVVLHRTLK